MHSAPRRPAPWDIQHHAVIVCTGLFLVAAAIPGANYEGVLSAPWTLLAEPLGATWLGLMGLFWGAASLMLRRGRWRSALGALGGVVLCLITGQAMARGAVSGVLDLPQALVTALGGSLLGRLVLIMLILATLAPPFWAIGRRRSMARWAAVGASLVGLLLVLWTSHLAFGDAMSGTAGGNIFGAMGNGNPLGDRVAAVVVLLGMMTLIGTAVTHLFLDGTGVHRAGAWMMWLTLVAIPMIILGAFAAVSANSAHALDATKYALVLSGGLILAATSVAAALTSPATTESAARPAQTSLR